mgnify:CR=1 FL=1
MSGFTHFDQKGNAVMVDVHEKADTYRVAVAAGTITVNEEVFQAITNHTAKKGDVLGIARIAGIMGAKKNSELIPLCHIIALTDCEISFELDEIMSVSDRIAVIYEGKIVGIVDAKDANENQLGLMMAGGGK